MHLFGLHVYLVTKFIGMPAGIVSERKPLWSLFAPMKNITRASHRDLTDFLCVPWRITNIGIDANNCSFQRTAILAPIKMCQTTS